LSGWKEFGGEVKEGLWEKKEEKTNPSVKYCPSNHSNVGKLNGVYMLIGNYAGMILNVLKVAK
jgi:hypothetical protein